METNEKRVCPQCGEELEEDALFCTECGASLTKKEKQPQAESPKAEPSIEEPPAESQKEELPSAESPKEEAPAEIPKENIPVGETLKEENAAKEEPSQTTAATVESASPTMNEEKMAGPGHQDVPTAPLPAAKPERKFCFRCGASIAMEAVFCNKCGAPQGAQQQIQQPQMTKAQPQFAATQMGQAPLPNSMNIDTAALKSWIHNGGLGHILLVVSVILAGSVFMPFAKGDGSGSLKLTDISVLLSIIVLLIAAGSAIASLREKYEVPVIAGHSLLAVYLCGVFKYQSAMKWGGFLLIPVIIGLIVVGLMAALQRDGKALDSIFLGEKWKQIMLQPVKIHTLNIQGIIGAVALALVMICVPLIGAVGGNIGKDKFEGEWYLWDTEPYTFWGETMQCANLTLMKIKKVSDNAYVVTRGYISGGSGAKKDFPRNRDDSLVFFIDKEHKGIIEDTNYRNPSAILHYFYDNESKTLLNQDNVTYNPVPFNGFSEQDIKKFYDESVKATTENNNQPHRVQNKICSLDEYKSMISEMEKEMDNALQAAEKQYKTTGHAYKVKGVNQ